MERSPTNGAPEAGMKVPVPPFSLARRCSSYAVPEVCLVRGRWGIVWAEAVEDDSGVEFCVRRRAVLREPRAAEAGRGVQ